MQEVFRKASPQLDNSATDRERAAQEEKLARAVVVLFGSGLRDPDQLERSALHGCRALVSAPDFQDASTAKWMTSASTTARSRQRK